MAELPALPLPWPVRRGNLRCAGSVNASPGGMGSVMDEDDWLSRRGERLGECVAVLVLFEVVLAVVPRGEMLQGVACVVGSVGLGDGVVVIVGKLVVDAPPEPETAAVKPDADLRFALAREVDVLCVRTTCDVPVLWWVTGLPFELVDAMEDGVKRRNGGNGETPVLPE